MPEITEEALSLSEKETFINLVLTSMAHCGVHCKYPSRELSGYIKPGYVRVLQHEKIRIIMPKQITCQLMWGDVARDTAREFYYMASQLERENICSTLCTLKCFN